MSHSFRHNLMTEQDISVRLSDDKLTAYLQINRTDDTVKYSVDHLERLLNYNLVQYGIDYRVLEQIADSPPSFVGLSVVVAAGEAPTGGDDGYIEFAHDTNGSRGPLVMDDDSVDLKEIVRLSNVRKGEKIAENIPPTEGKPGKTVTGETLLPSPGKKDWFKIGKNVVADTENTALYSLIDGLVTLTEDEKINVFPIYEVNGDVDYHTGNIEFVGTVIIRGNVLAGFRVKADGDIRVIGGVEGAEVEAGGSIEISAGVVGGNKGFVKAGKSVKCSFILEGNVYAEENVIVSQSIMHSHLRAGNSVICKGSKGLIVGGVIQAVNKVTARTIGNSMSTPTVIEVGVLPALRNELAELRLQMKNIGDGLESTEKALVLLDQLAVSGQISKEKLGLKMRLGHTKKQSIKQLDEMKERILTIEKMIGEGETAKVEIWGAIYSGTKIVLGRNTFFVRDATRHVLYELVGGDIVSTAIQ